MSNNNNRPNQPRPNTNIVRRQRNQNRNNPRRNPELFFNNNQTKFQILTSSQLTSSDTGSVSFEIDSAWFKADPICEGLLKKFAEFKPLGISVKFIIDKDVSTNFDNGHLVCYHWNSGFNAPRLYTNLPAKRIINGTSVVHIYGGFARRWYGDINFEGGLLLKADNMPKGKVLGTFMATMTIVCH